MSGSDRQGSVGEIRPTDPPARAGGGSVGGRSAQVRRSLPRAHALDVDVSVDAELDEPGDELDDPLVDDPLLEELGPP